MLMRGCIRRKRRHGLGLDGPTLAAGLFAGISANLFDQFIVSLSQGSIPSGTDGTVCQVIVGMGGLRVGHHAGMESAQIGISETITHVLLFVAEKLAHFFAELLGYTPLDELHLVAGHAQPAADFGDRLFVDHIVLKGLKGRIGHL